MGPAAHASPAPLIAGLLAVSLAATAGAAPADVADRSIVLVVDNSGSMRANDPEYRVREAISELAEELGNADRVGLIVFDETARVVRPLRRLDAADSRSELLSAVQMVDYAGRWTNIPDAIERAVYELKEDGAQPGRSVIVLITDGKVDTGSAERDAAKGRWLREDLIPDARASGIRIFGVAFTEGADYELLQSMAHGTSGAYVRALTTSDVEGIFAELQEALAKPVEEPPAPAVRPPAAPAGAQAVPPAPVRLETQEPRYLKPLVFAALALGLIGLAIAIFKWRSTSEPFSRGQDSVADGPVPEAVLEEIASGQRHPVNKRTVLVGRASDCDVVLPHSTISAQHAKIECRGGSFYVTDLRSLNGTYVNAERVDDEVMVRDGDVLRFDRFELAFRGGATRDGARKLWSAGEHTMLRMVEPGGAAASATRIFSGVPSSLSPETEEVEDPSTAEQPALDDPFPSEPVSDLPRSLERRIAGPEAAVALGETDDEAEPYEESADEAEAAKSRPRLVEPAGQRCRRHVFTVSTARCERCESSWCERCVRIVGDERLCPECGWKL